MEEKPNSLQFKFSIPEKAVHIPRFFGQPNQQKINRRRQNMKPYLPVIITPGFEEIKDLTLERSSRPMRQPIVQPAIKS